MTKLTTFDARFRKSAFKVAAELGLDFISTKRQVENGSLMFYDDDTDTKYTISESGYVRRYIRGTYSFQPTWRAYQLNPTTQSKIPTHTYKGEQMYRTETIRHMVLDPNAQLGILVKAVINYREKNC